MAKDKTNMDFNLDDFRRYENGSMSFEEQRLLEKRMLEDPFLAEAYEGFKSVGLANLNSAVIDKELTERLENRIQTKKRNAVPLWAYSAAAMLLIGFTVGWLIYLNKQSLPARKIKSEELSSIMKPESQIADTAKSGPTSLPFEKNDKYSIKKSLPPNAQDNVAVQDATKEVLDQGNLIKGESLAAYDEARTINAPEPSPSAFSAPAQMLAKTSTLARDSMPRGDMLSGQLLDNNNQPIAGATIVSSKTVGTLTDLEGHFSIQAEIGDSLSALFVGYKTKVFKAEKADLGTIKLDDDLQALNEVVITGYGAQQKKSVGAKEVSNSAEPVPAIGWPSYNEYLKKSTSVSLSRGSVEVSFLVSETGLLSDFKATGKAELVERAIQIVKDGPEWKPAISNGSPISKKMKITLKFR